MATEDLKSSVITNRDATPVVLSTANPGTVRRAYGLCECAGGDLGSTYRFCSIPSNAKCVRAFYSCDDLGTSVTMNIGLYQTTGNGAAVVDADFFASALDVATAAVGITEITFERGATLIDELEDPLWERLSLTADPSIDYDVVGVSAGAAATGTVAVWIEYVV